VPVPRIDLSRCPTGGADRSTASLPDSTDPYEEDSR
jgi:hypothetical protein